MSDKSMAIIPAGEPELITPSPQAREWMERAQLDVAITTAKKYPRPEIGQIRQNMLSLASIDEETAESCIYTLKRWDQQAGQHKLIQGPSIRLAEILIHCWGNLRAGAHTIENDGRRVTAQGICFDLQANVMQSAEVSRRITDKNGRLYSEDMQIMAAAAACAIAKRNAVFSVVPFALIKPVYEKVKQVVTGNVSTLQVKRDKLFRRFYAMGVTQAQILAVLAKESIDSVDLEDCASLIGLGTAIKDREITIEEAFTVPAVEEEEAAEATARPTLGARLAAMRAARKAAAEKQPSPESEEKSQ